MPPLQVTLLRLNNTSSGTAGQTISNPGTFGGLTYNFGGPTLVGGIITNQFNSFSGLSLGGHQSGGAQFFFGGDSVTVTFATPVNAVGVFFNVNLNSGNYDMNTPVGSAITGSASYDTATFVFDGITSTTPFSTITLVSGNTSLGSYNIPEIEFASTTTVPPVPLPGCASPLRHRPRRTRPARLAQEEDRRRLIGLGT
jgi:hypothetical protein